MRRKTRKRARVVALDLAQFEPMLAADSAVGRAASEAGMRLVTARAYPCADGSFTVRFVWRKGEGRFVASMVETLRGLRLPA